MAKIEGGNEADAQRCFLASMLERVGDWVYNFDACILVSIPRRPSDRTSARAPCIAALLNMFSVLTSMFMWGAPPATSNYTYWMHCTGDIRTATFRVGDTLAHDQGTSRPRISRRSMPWR